MERVNHDNTLRIVKHHITRIPSKYTLSSLHSNYVSAGPHYDVNTTVGINNVTNLANLESISRFLKRFLHLASPKRTKIAATLRGAAVGEARGEVLELGLAGDDVLPEGLELRDGALAGCAADDPALRILPRGLPPGALVLDEDVRRADLIRRRHLGLRPVLVPEAAGFGGGWIGR